MSILGHAVVCLPNTRAKISKRTDLTTYFTCRRSFLLKVCISKFGKKKRGKDVRSEVETDFSFHLLSFVHWLASNRTFKILAQQI
jgi:hypothetical protein